MADIEVDLTNSVGSIFELILVSRIFNDASSNFNVFNDERGERIDWRRERGWLEREWGWELRDDGWVVVSTVACGIVSRSIGVVVVNGNESRLSWSAGGAVYELERDGMMNLSSVVGVKSRLKLRFWCGCVVVVVVVGLSGRSLTWSISG